MGRLAGIAVTVAVALGGAAEAQAALTPSGVQRVVTTMVSKATTGVAAVAGSPQDVAGAEGSATARALAFQSRLADDVPLRDAPWIGTHNSFNSVAEMGPALSALDSNQRLTLVDQLRLGVRSLELDAHFWLGRPTVCHALPNHGGCTVEKPLDTVLAEIRGWLDAHPSEVVLLYVEDHLDAEPGYAAAAAVVERVLGDELYRPPAGACTQLPAATLDRDAVRAAGRQVVLVSDCGPGTAWRSVAFAWDDHVESRPRGFRPFPDCGPDFTRAEYDGTLVRYFEDSTTVTATASLVDAASVDDGLTPATTAAMVRCGVDLFGFDQLVAHDARLDAAVWSWAPGQPAAGAGDCVVRRGSDGRWVAAPCAGTTVAGVACRDASSGAWSVAAVGSACAAAPRTGYENSLLGVAAGGADVLVGLTRAGGAYVASDTR